MEVAEGALRFGAGRLGIPALRNQFLGAPLQVIVQFALNVSGHRLLLRQGQRVVGAGHQTIAPVGRASSTRVMADT